MPTPNLIHSILEKSRRDLLDLSTRNRLLSTPRERTRSTRVEIVGELSEQVFDRLAVSRKAMTFLPAPATEADEGKPASESPSETPPQPDAIDPAEGESEEPRDASQTGQADGSATQARQDDGRLQTDLSAETLEKRLLRLYYDARTYEEEQGVNILYLALGFLRWYEANDAQQPRYAPLVLLPVSLERQKAGARFRLRARDEEITTNLSLQAKLAAEFGIKLPELPDVEEFSPSRYFEEVAQAIAAEPRWEVLPNDIVLWFFSFARFLMFRDLQPDTWPAEQPLAERPLLGSLLQDGFRDEPPLCGDDDKIDGLIPPPVQTHVVDADSSQCVAIEEVRQGRNLVIQGPPGTGKSQTITNLIATAVKQGKRVLFVAEKMAALEVVKRRLDHIGLGDMCLELHSHKANKGQVLDDLRRTLDLSRPRTADGESCEQDWQTTRDALNGHAEVMHRPIGETGVTPYQAIGALVRLRTAGITMADFEFEQGLAWSRDGRRAKRNQVRELAAHLEEVGNPAVHPWRGVCADALLPMDIERLMRQLPDLARSIEELIEVANRLAGVIQVAVDPSLARLRELANLAQALATAPELDAKALAHDAWAKQREAIVALVKDGASYAACRQRLEGVVAETGWTTNVALARSEIARHGRSWLRWLSSTFAQAQETLRRILVQDLPKGMDERLAILDTLLRGQAAAARIQTGNDLGTSAFGDLWLGAKSDWARLAAIDAWEADTRKSGVPDDFRRHMLDPRDREACQACAQQMTTMLAPAMAKVSSVLALLALDTRAAFGEGELARISLAEVRDRLRLWMENKESLVPWIAYSQRYRQAPAQGLAPLAEALHAGQLQPQAAGDAFDMAFHEQVARQAFREHPSLARFNGPSQDRLVAEFQELDQRRLDQARVQVALAHHQGIPSGQSGIGEVGLIRREVEKKRRRLPLRQLLKEAGRAIQAIKPVFMMSPVSIAQFLEPGRLSFDLLLIDEASQVRPVDALVAVARAGQIVVVGDDKQLPPTTFFSKLTEEEDPTEDEGPLESAGDLESILGLCRSKGMAQRMLRWHYRSRHHSLIAVSNREFYDNRLFVPPSADRGGGEGGLRFQHVPDGTFDRGGTRCNEREAAMIAQAVMEHAESSPHRSLGVGAFSIAQRDAIERLLEELRKQRSDLEPFFESGKTEPFFVKNLENIQGDERDVIFISVGYGTDASGHMTMNFGPLSVDGGERRLNVLISRAKEQCRVFSSITAGDIDLGRARSRGVAALKAFLEYAQTGRLSAAAAAVGDPASEFEDQVATAVRSLGYQVELQVGVAGFFVDLAVVDPESPARYLLGIECDGAMYHASRSALDRDRLRQQVLESRGWTLHRIWSTDWFRQPDQQIRKVKAAIECAKTGPPRPGTPAAAPREIERAPEDNAAGPDLAALGRPYQEAAIPPGDPRPIPDVPVDRLARDVVSVVEIEGPVHADEVARRMARIWNCDRTGSRIVGAVQAALDHAQGRGQLECEGPFYTVTGRVDVPIRSRESVTCATLKRPEMLPPQEIRQAVMHIVETHVGAACDEVILQATRLLGFRATSAPLKERVLQEVVHLIEQRRLQRLDDKLYLA